MGLNNEESLLGEGTKTDSAPRMSKYRDFSGPYFPLYGHFCAVWSMKKFKLWKIKLFVDPRFKKSLLCSLGFSRDCSKWKKHVRVLHLLY